MEAARKQAIRDGDPMAVYIQQQAELAEQEGSGKTTTSTGRSHAPSQPKAKRPVYSGPTPTPNRFHIRPGYRWDAIERGNGFESKLLLKLNERSSRKDDEYKWSVSDL